MYQPTDLRIRQALSQGAETVVAIYNMGIEEVGTHEKHAKLDDAWLDVVIVEKLLPVNLT
jgi:hypothetical protein